MDNAHAPSCENQWSHYQRDAAQRIVFARDAVTLLAATTTFALERGLGATGHDWDLTFAQRLALIGQSVAFYAHKLALPLSLSFVYPKWPIDPTSPTTWLPSLALAAALLATLRAQRPAFRAAGLALWIYAANLLPVSGLVDFYYLRYAFVADHFQYLASLGPIAFACCGGAWLLRSVPRAAACVLAIGVTLPLALGSWQHSHTFVDVETLWRDTIATEPNAWLAHTNLGVLHADRGDPGGGIEHHRRALAIYPDAFESNNAVGNHLVGQGDFEAAQRHFDRALAVRPQHPLTYQNLGTMAGSRRDYRGARRWLERAFELAPNHRDVIYNLVLVLSQAPDAAVRDGPRALQLARELNARPQPTVLEQHALFFAMLLAGDRGEAIALGRRVLDRARREGDEATARRVARQLQRLGQ